MGVGGDGCIIGELGRYWVYVGWGVIKWLP